MTNKEVIQAIMNTKKVLNDHWKKTVSMRLNGPGSHYHQHNEVKTLEADLLEAEWEEYLIEGKPHPAIMKGAVGYTAKIPGQTGMMKLDLLSNPENYEVKLTDAKNTGFLSAVIEAKNKLDRLVQLCMFTVIIIGEHEGEKVVFTFHPGDPVEPSSITGEERTVTVQEARELGFDLAKIELSD